jgi:hypothetical protein
VAGLDAAALVGLLADRHRRKVVAAIELGSRHVEDIVASTGLNSAQVAKALGKLVETGLVEQRDGLTIATEAFRDAAKVANMRVPTQEFAELPDADRKVLRAFVVDGRLRSIPTSGAKRLVVLNWLAQDFEPGRRYSEQMVNLILGRRYADTAALRRHLVDHGFLDRAGGEYWRSGGTVGE